MFSVLQVLPPLKTITHRTEFSSFVMFVSFVQKILKECEHVVLSLLGLTLPTTELKTLFSRMLMSSPRSLLGRKKNRFSTFPQAAAQVSVPGLNLVTVSSWDGEIAAVCPSHNNGGMQAESAWEHSKYMSHSFRLATLCIQSRHSSRTNHVP